jgi:hypothetical protein
MPIKSAGAMLSEHITDAIDALKTCVTPIFDIGKHDRPELKGSAVLIHIAGATFLCTAKHVIDKNAISPLYIDGPNSTETLEGDFCCSPEHDLAVLKLTTSQIKCLQKYVPLPPERIASVLQASACKYAEFVGFPETKNRLRHRSHEISRHIQSIGGMIIAITHTRVRVAFDRKLNIEHKTRQKVTSPDPHGMSGGAIFGVLINAALLQGKSNPLLIGITTDLPTGRKEVFGPNIAIVVAVIRDAYHISIPPRLNPMHIKSRSGIGTVT